MACRRIRLLAVGLLLLVLLVTGISCTTVEPITGRRQLSLIPASSLNSMGFQQYQEFINKNKLSQDAGKTAMVKRVGRRVQKAVEKYFADRGKSYKLKDYAWEFNLVEDKQVNAWCMPGGRVVVYTGILPIAQDEAGLAAIIGHEVAHAVANHGRERMSQALLVSLGGLALDQAMKDKPGQTRKWILAAYGAGSTVGILLPYSRTQENSADHLGMIFMAMAGYDPSKAPELWERMAKKGGKTPPEFLSTHPAPETRIRKLRALIPEAKKHYRKVDQGL